MPSVSTCIQLVDTDLDPTGSVKFRCLDPMQLQQEAARLNLEVDHWLGKPNCYYNPRGKGPGRAFILLTRGDVEALISASSNLDANYTLEFIYGSTNRILMDLRILKTHALYTDSFNPGDATPYLVELVDYRGAFHLSALTNQAFNVLCPAPPADADAGADYSTDTSLYYADSLNSGALWTWQTMLNEIWGELPGQATSDCPTLPFSPHDYPRNFRFVGVSAWDAFHTVLEKIGCVLNYDPIDRSFSLSRLATTQYLGVLDSDNDLLGAYAPIEGTVQRPETIRVLFHRREEHHGSEKEIQQATGNWIDAGPYAKDITTSLPGAVTGTILPIWDDMPAVYTFDDTHLNSAACDARAAEVAADLANQIQNSNSSYRRMFRGIRTDVGTGSKITSVTWGDRGDSLGMVTEYRGSDILTPSPLQPASGVGVKGPFSPREHGCRPVAESLLPTAIMRQGLPTYPRLCQLVTADGSGYQSANGSNLFPGKVARIDPEVDPYATGSYTDDVACWIACSDEDAEKLYGGTRYVGRLIGSFDVSSDIRPLFVVEPGKLDHQARWIKFAVTAAFDTGDSSVGIDTVSYGDGYQPGTEPTTVYNVRADAADTYIFGGADNARGLALYNPMGGKYYIVQMECP